MLYKANIKTGAPGPKSPKEKRKIAAEKDVQEQEEQKRLQQDALTFSQIFTKDYFPIAKANKTKRVWATEDSLFNLWIEPTIGSLPLKDISPIRLEKIKKNMADAGRAPRSIAYVLSVIRQVYNFARRAGLYAGEWPISMSERYSHLQPGTFQSAVKILEQGVTTARQNEHDRVKAEQDQQDGQVVNFTK